MVLFSGIYNWAYLNVYCYGVEMKNWGQIERKIKIKKRYTLSPYVLNLTVEYTRWKKLTKALNRRIKSAGI